MSSRTTRLASGLTWTLVTKFAIVKPRAAAAAGDGTTASRTASATSARAIPSAPERDAGRLPLSGAEGIARALGIGRAQVCTPVTDVSRMLASALQKKKEDRSQSEAVHVDIMLTADTA